jgi:hypothetical protein
MSASIIPPSAQPRFSVAELAVLAKTADALSAYLGKPVLAEIGETDSGAEWVAFGVPLEPGVEDDEHTHVQMGGPQARILGNRGGLPHTDADVYDCIYLWAIEITGNEGERFVKLDHEGEEAAWSDDLAEVLPFTLGEEGLISPDEEDEDDEDDEDDDDDYEDDNGDDDVPDEPRPPLRRH